MATLFRPGQTARNPTVPPSSFRRNLMPEDKDKTLRRTSRVDLDFEAALQSPSTITLREGRDVNLLGHEGEGLERKQNTEIANEAINASIGSPLSPALSKKLRKTQPAPTANGPPTSVKSRYTEPSPLVTALPSGSGVMLPSDLGSRRPSATSIQNHSAHGSPAHGRTELPQESPIPRPPKPNEDLERDGTDFDMKRRSLFRSPGTASSPDLATLVRKQRERNAALPNLPPSAGAADREAGASRLGFVEQWGTVSGRQRTISKEGGKPPKSMRAKTSSFITKMFGGTGTLRDRSHDSTSHSRSNLVYYNHSNHSAYAESPSPPVPSIPEAYRSQGLSPSIRDVFPNPASKPAEPSKPLPPIQVPPPSSDSGDDIFVDATDGSSSIVLVSSPPSPAQAYDKTPQPSPQPRPLPDVASRTINRSLGREGKSRRRSMSVGDAEQWHKVLGNGIPEPKREREREERTSSSSAVKDWESALSGFDAQMASLEITDPSSPARIRSRRGDIDGIAPNQKILGQDRKGSLRNELLPLTSAPKLTLSPVLSPPSNNSPMLSPTLSISSTASAPVSSQSNGMRRPRRTSSGRSPYSPTMTAPSPRVATLRQSSTGTSSPMASPLERRPSATLSPSTSITVRGAPREPTVSLTSPSRESLPTQPGRSRVQPRSSASASEPALVQGGPEEGMRTVRLVPGRHSSSGSSASGRKDLTTDDLVNTKFGGSRPSLSGPSGDVEGMSLEMKGQHLAQRMWEEDETFRPRERFSEWLGHPDPLNGIALKHYINHFDFYNLRLDMAFRRLCAKLYLRGETQVIDRILIEFSRRYFEHNPNCPLGSASNVHQVVYSLLLLNTDLHIAELASHMTKQQFLNNTMTTLQIPSSMPPISSTSGSNRPSTSSTPVRSSSPAPDDSSERGRLSVNDSRPDPNATVRTKRSGSVHSWKGSGSGTVTPSNAHLHAPTGSPSVNVSSSSVSEFGLNSSPLSTMGRKHGSGQGSVSSIQFTKGWEAEVEIYLKDMYTDIKKQQILQPISSTGMLTPGATLGRGLSQRRSGNDRIANLKRGSIRGLQGLITAQAANGSSSSIDGRISPSPSVATSFNDGMTASSSTLYTPGFASNLTQTIIKETQEDDAKSINSDISNTTSVSISDEELALLGAPWAKEGMLCKRQAWETVGKKAKNNKWMDVFVVIQKGHLSMFTFGDSSSNGGSRGGVVGGGNWLKNAHPVGEFMLSHSLAHILPPPGISKRPNCFVLSLSDGAVYFFQAGTEELANEWVSTCNYWAARQSKEPLPGGVSNIEYGWSRVEDDAYANIDDDGSVSEAEKMLEKERENRAKGDYNTDTYSMRSQRSRLGVRLGDGLATLRGGSSPYSERIYITEWKPPMPNMHVSTLDEEGQLESLQRQTETLKEELKKHDALKAPMTSLYTAKSTNLTKATDNWNKRSRYLLTETVKYELYIDSLKVAMKERLKRRGEKALEKALHQTDSPSTGRKWGFKEEETIEETEEPTTPGPNQGGFKHRREGAVENEELAV